MTVNAKVVQAMKKLQTSYYKDANKIVEQAAQEKAAKKNLIFFTDLAPIAMVSEDIKPTKAEPWAFNKACNHPNPKS